MDKYLKHLRAFQRILNCNLRIYEPIWYENYDFMSQKWENMNQKFALLKVALHKKFGQHFPLHSTALHPLPKWCHCCLFTKNKYK